DDVADAGVATPGAAEHPDAKDLLCTGVVGDLEPRLLLDHLLSPGCLTGSPASSSRSAGAWWNGWDFHSDLSASRTVLAASDADNSGLVTWPSRGRRPDASAWWR